MKKQFVAWLLAICLVAGSGGFSAYAEGDSESGSKPLEDIFYQTVIFPFDYQGKVFIHGYKATMYEKYEVVQRKGRVLVPIRLMGYLAGQSGNPGEGTWDVVWNPKTPDVVLINNTAKGRSIKFTVNSKMMLVNKKPVPLEVPPQKINGRVVLPLRDAALALEKQINWLDGLILIGDTPLDVKHARTLSIKDAVKAELADSRKFVDYEKSLTPIAKNGSYIYYYKRIYDNNKITDELYRKADGQKAKKVAVPGNPLFSFTKTLGGELYFVTVVKGSTELYAYSFDKNQFRKVSSLGSWNPSDGWLSDIRQIDGELYVNLHTGDNTMGSDTLYRVEKGSLKEVLSAKSLIQFVKSGKTLYYTDFKFMGDPTNNLYRMDMATGQEVPLGEPGFTYGIHRTISDGGGVGYSSNGTLHLKDGYLYVLGYKEEDAKDLSAVYKISLADQTQVRLTSPARNFWVKDDRIYFIDAQTGFLVQTDLNGENREVVSKKAVFQVSFHDGFIYYLVNDGSTPSEMGVLYRYDIKLAKEVKLSDQIAASYHVDGGSDVYYVAGGYKPGIYKVDRNGRNVPLVRDNVSWTLGADKGIVYTLEYKEGVFYAVK